MSAAAMTAAAMTVANQHTFQSGACQQTEKGARIPPEPHPRRPVSGRMCASGASGDATISSKEGQAAHAELYFKVIDVGWVREADELWHHISKRHPNTYSGPDGVVVVVNTHRRTVDRCARRARLLPQRVERGDGSVISTDCPGLCCCNAHIKSALAFCCLWAVLRNARCPRVRARVVVTAHADGVSLVNITITVVEQHLCAPTRAGDGGGRSVWPAVRDSYVAAPLSKPEGCLSPFPQPAHQGWWSLQCGAFVRATPARVAAICLAEHTDALRGSGLVIRDGNVHVVRHVDVVADVVGDRLGA